MINVFISFYIQIYVICGNFLLLEITIHVIEVYYRWMAIVLVISKSLIDFNKGGNKNYK